MSATTTVISGTTNRGSTTPAVCIDGNEAAARAAYALSETVAIYPITPASPMGEHADAWAAKGVANAWGVVPSVSQLQSEAGADVVMATSSLLKHGPEHAAVLLEHLRAWLEVRGYASVREMVGAVSQQKVPDPAAFERANYLATLTRYANARKGW